MVGFSQRYTKADTMRSSAVLKLSAFALDLQQAVKICLQSQRHRLIPCLRKFGIKFFAYSPLAYVTITFLLDEKTAILTIWCRAGLLSGRVLTTEPDGTISSASGSRFNTSLALGNLMQGRYKPLLPIFVELKEILVRRISPSENIINSFSYPWIGKTRHQYAGCSAAMAATSQCSWPQ